MNVNWRWHARFRGLLPLSPHALADDGTLFLVRPDELEARTYEVLHAGADGAVKEQESLTVETVRRMALTAEAPLRIGVTDDDLYLFREGRKSRFLPQRRVSYLDVALARGGAFFAAAFTDMMFSGQTLCLADETGKTLWTKDMDAPIGVVAIAPEGRAVAAGLESGELLVFDAGRAPLWGAALAEPIIAVALGESGSRREGGRCVAATASGAVLAIEDGDVVWRADLVSGVALTPGEVVIATGAQGALTAVGGGDDGSGWLVLLDAEGQAAWEHETTARVTGVALSPSGALLALSQADGAVLLFEIENLPSASARRPAEEFQRALAARDAGQTAEAREALLRALEADPGHLAACDALIALDEATHAAALAEADRRLEEGRFAEALAALGAARAVAPADPELPQRWAGVLEAAETRLTAEAAAAEAAGDPETAAARWRALLQLDPKRRRAREEVARLNRLVADRWAQEGEAALAAGREEEGLAAWRRAQAAAPSDALAARLRELEVQRFVRAGVALYGQQRFQEAAFQFRKALALQADHGEALRYLAYIGGTGPQSSLSERFSRLE
jgi:outer membrane protein assembly factor BamB